MPTPTLLASCWAVTTMPCSPSAWDAGAAWPGAAANATQAKKKAWRVTAQPGRRATPGSLIRGGLLARRQIFPLQAVLFLGCALGIGIGGEIGERGLRLFRAIIHRLPVFHRHDALL